MRCAPEELSSGAHVFFALAGWGSNGSNGRNGRNGSAGRTVRTGRHAVRDWETGRTGLREGQG